MVPKILHTPSSIAFYYKDTTKKDPKFTETAMSASLLSMALLCFILIGSDGAHLLDL